jgi:RNA polymerase sigma factor (sigma-70 family)
MILEKRSAMNNSLRLDRYYRYIPPQAIDELACFRAAHPLKRTSDSCVMHTPSDEETLIQAACAGDLEAFNTLVLLHQDRVYNLAYRILGDQSSAADAVQEAFILAYRHIHRFHTGSFFAWLYRIATNVCYDAVRYQKRRPAVPFTHLSEAADDDHEFDLPAHEDGPETLVQRRELAALLQQHISALPIDQRTVLVLSDVQGLSDKEIAAIMRCNLGTVKSRLSRARAKMRRSLSSAQLN